MVCSVPAGGQVVSPGVTSASSSVRLCTAGVTSQGAMGSGGSGIGAIGRGSGPSSPSAGAGSVMTWFYDASRRSASVALRIPGTEAFSGHDGQLHPGGEAELGVDVAQVALDGAA